MSWLQTIGDDIVSKIIAVPSVSSVAEVFNEDQVAKATKQVSPPFIAVAYMGRVRGAHPKAKIVNYGILGVGLNACQDPDGTIKDATTDILDDIIAALEAACSPVGHKYVFARETPVDTDAYSGYLQIWETRANRGP